MSAVVSVKMDASIQNAKEALGVLFAPAAAAVAQKIADMVTGTMDAAKAEVDPLQVRISDVTDQMLERRDREMPPRPCGNCPASAKMRRPQVVGGYCQSREGTSIKYH